MKSLELTITLPEKIFTSLKDNSNKYLFIFIIGFLSSVSVILFVYYYQIGLSLSYNDARSHLDIGRRVVEGLKPGLAQLGSVWLPLPHVLMVPTVWNDFFWHSGLSGSLQSMISFVITSIVIYKFLSFLKVGLFGRLVGVFVFVANLNVLYLQSIAMTELLLIGTMTLGVYELVTWFKKVEIIYIIRAAFWIMLATLVRYDGWFLLFMSTLLVGLKVLKEKGYKTAEGLTILFVTLAGFGIALWFLWNQLIFKDALYFAFGPFSARAQQQQLEEAGVLATKGDLILSLKVYLYALIFNSGAFTALLGLVGAILLLLDKSIKLSLRASIIGLLFTPFLFNILALVLGHSVLFVQGISGDTWFNVRYGVMMMPSIAIFVGYLIYRLANLKWVIVGLLLFVTTFSFLNGDAVTIDDALVGSSQKNVSEVSGYLKAHATDKKGFILISAASHDAIIFSSGLPMKRFIHEGTGSYWESATTSPDRWARWIVMRTHDDNDLTWKAVSRVPGFKRYDKVAEYPFADVYQLREEFIAELNTDPTLKNNK
ncbi:hypothetical protein HYW54_02140 [Candidatus Gottesmanbacteria bacterium]|nr:hypothetical protein [Candidatus Gottesmanbacteria bacterium]